MRMVKIRVTDVVVTFNNGAVIGMLKDQYKARQHNLEELPQRGVYRVINQVQFKRGEELRVKGDCLDKAMLARVEIVNKAKETVPETVTLPDGGDENVEFDDVESGGAVLDPTA